MIFNDRMEAGELLGEKLLKYRGEKNSVVVALARGGVAVGAITAEILEIPLEAMVVRKLGTPGDEELAMGAVTEDGKVLENSAIVRGYGVTKEEFEAERAKQLRVLKERMEKYQRGRKRLGFKGKSIILVDDGIATGATVKAAIKFLRREKVEKIILAVPVAPADTLDELRGEVDEVVVLFIPEYFGSVGQFYHAFDQVSDAEVVEILGKRLT